MAKLTIASLHYSISRRNTSIHLILGLIILLAGFLRLYRLPELYNFLGDQGRDAIIASDILTFKNLPVIGPESSAGDFFMGPFYYYFVAFGLGLAGFNPIGPVILIALFSVVTTALLYLVFSRYMHSRSTGLVAAYLYAISPAVVMSARFSWNPNLIPFFILTLLIGLLEFIRAKQTRWLLVSAVSLAVLFQLHYLTLLFIPVVLVFFLAHRHLVRFSQLVSYFSLAALSFVPLIVFDLTHNFINYHGLTQFATDSITGLHRTELINKLPIQTNPLLRYNAIWSLFVKNAVAVSIGSVTLAILSFLTILGIIKELLSDNITATQQGFLKFTLYWLFIGFILYSLYQGAVYPYHYTLFYPLAASIIALAWWLFIRWLPDDSYKYLGTALLVIFLAMFTNKVYPIHLQNLTEPGNLKISIIERAVNTIADQAGGQPFNFALVSQYNYDSAYRYFFARKNLPVEYTDTVTDQLFVVCEDIRDCRVEGNPKWEIAIFDTAYQGRIKRVGETSIDNIVQVIKLVGNK